MLKIKRSPAKICWHIVWEHGGSETLLQTTDTKWEAERIKETLERRYVYNV